MKLSTFQELPVPQRDQIQRPLHPRQDLGRDGAQAGGHRLRVPLSPG